MPDIEERIKEVMAENLGVGIEKLTPEAGLITDLDADSLDMVELVLALEEEFDVTIPEEDASDIRTVGQAIDYIKKHKEG